MEGAGEARKQLIRKRRGRLLKKVHSPHPSREDFMREHYFNIE
jgi:hypothetical protein